MPDDEVGRLSLKEYQALIDRKVANDNRLRLNAGIIAAAVHNAAPNFGDKPRDAISPLEFVPDWNNKGRDDAHDLTKMSPEEQRDYVYGVFGKRSYTKRS